MNKVQKLYLIIAALLGVGIPFFFVGIQVPSAIEAAILADAAEYSILDEEDNDFWAVLPGRTGMMDIKRFYIFNCTNPEEVALTGEEPKFNETGPFTYKYSHLLSSRVYEGDSRIKDTKVNFYREFSHEYLRSKESSEEPDDLKKEYRITNIIGFKKWANIKKKERFQLAIEGFFETFQYSRLHFLREMVVRNISTQFKDTRKIFNLLINLNLTRDVEVDLASNKRYGLVRDENVYDWTFMCDSFGAYIEHEILGYFGLALDKFKALNERFCELYINIRTAKWEEACKKIEVTNCSDYSISFSQWMYGKAIGSYKEITYKKLHGIYEFFNFTKKFKEMLQDKYTKQFESVVWNDKSYDHLLHTYHNYPHRTDPASLLLFENMKRLFIAGKATKNPFKAPQGESTGEVGSEELDLSRFEDIARTLKVKKENAFMLYSYFDYYVNNTVLLSDKKGDIETERIGNYGAVVIRDIVEYFRDFIDLLIYSHTLHHEHPEESCEAKVKRYFEINETKGIMDNLVKAICDNKRFNTDISTPVGWKYFLESVSYPEAHFHKDLYGYLKDLINLPNDTFYKMIYGSQSPFFKALDKIKKDVKVHYNKVTGETNPDRACENKYSPYCTKRQFFVTQFYDAAITKQPYPKSKLKEADSIASWWRLIEPYIENGDIPEGAQFMEERLPDLPIEVPVEIPYLTKSYNVSKPGFTKEHVYNCFNYINFFDTDVLYDLFVKVVTNKSDDGPCKTFSNKFFYNSTKYLIRNVQFGPMFKRLYPEQVYFGYYDNFTRVEHNRIDYLRGDDCTVNPSVGYNPKFWKGGKDPTFSHFANKNKMYTGLINNDQLRRYIDFYGRNNITYQKLRFDETGDECTFETSSPFTEPIHLNDETDGYQFSQYKGKAPKGHKMAMIEPNLYRPLHLIKKTYESDVYQELDVNAYEMEFRNDIMCPDGQFMSFGMDMSSFYQYRTVFTMPRYQKVSEPGLKVPKNIQYKHPIDDDTRPYGFDKHESYYLIEPYTGITMSYKKKLMLSIVLRFDDLYEGKSIDNAGQFLPLYALYENADAGEGFIDAMRKGILSSHDTRLAISISFSVIGGLFIAGGIVLIIRSCFFKPEEITGLSENLLMDNKSKAVDGQLEKVYAEVTQGEEEDLQKERYGRELKNMDDMSINSSFLQAEESHGIEGDNLLP